MTWVEKAQFMVSILRSGPPGSPWDPVAPAFSLLQMKQSALQSRVPRWVYGKADSPSLGPLHLLALPNTVSLPQLPVLTAWLRRVLTPIDPPVCYSKWHLLKSDPAQRPPPLPPN